MSDSGIWVGLLLSIPLSILANVATPRVQRWLDARNRTRALQRTAGMASELAQVTRYVKDRGEFREYLLWTIIRTTFVGALCGIISGLIFVIPRILPFDRMSEGLSFAQNAAYSGGQAVGIVGALLIINICRAALKTYYNVTNYSEYEAHVVRHLNDTGASSAS
jgi:hypothetical protein